MRLSVEELAEIRASLDGFVGLTLTDCWDACGRIFEFGEQIAFVNRNGEEVNWATRLLKSLNRFEIEGLVGGILNSDNYSDDERMLTKVAIEFLHRMNAGEFRVEAISVSELGEVKTDFASAVSLRIFGRTIGRVSDGESSDGCWILTVPGRSVLLYEAGLNAGPHVTLELAANELKTLRKDLRLMLDAQIIEFYVGSELLMKLRSHQFEFDIVSTGFDARQVRIDGRRPAWGDSDWINEFGPGICLGRVFADRTGTVSLWFGMRMIRLDAEKGWTLKSGEFEYRATSSGLVRNSC
ncbi:hypothetical protein CCB80_00700 [Armatimonadetes bacterium Uphvl-Ar1]|nr:hypothetical protein CCB80_00700 [Armatimonadetes bacterium Uphvl-Ar1]